MCDVCGGNFMVQSHHPIGGNPGRKLSDKYPLMKFSLCHNCHHAFRTGIHGGNIKLDLLLKRIVQENFEKNYGTHEEFMRLFKRDYIEYYKAKIGDEFYYNSNVEFIKINQRERLEWK